MHREHPLDPSLSGIQIGGGLHLPCGHPQPLPAVLDVVTCVFNPYRFASRSRLFHQWEKRTLDAGARLTVVECAFGERPFEVTKPGVSFDTTEGRLQYVQLRSASTLWLKESLLNAGISRLPRDWRYVAWIDADTLFSRLDWAQETMQQLQHHEIVQLFSHWMNLKSDYSPLGPPKKSFMGAYADGDPLPASGSYYGSGTVTGAHPGFAWAARREAIDMLGGLLETAVLGSADRHMGYALLGRVTQSAPDGLSKGYIDSLRVWQDRAERLHRNVGVMRGTLLHFWHGALASRKYQQRWRILVEEGYDPGRDLRRDWQGICVLTNRSVRLRDRIRAYFSQRNEDQVP